MLQIFFQIFVSINTIFPSQDRINILLFKQFLNFGPVLFTTIVLQQSLTFLVIFLLLSFLNYYVCFIFCTIKIPLLSTHAFLLSFIQISKAQIYLNIIFVLFKEIVLKTDDIVRLKSWRNHC